MQLPAEIPWLSHTFPFYTAISETATGIRETVLASLPDQAKARELVTIYYRHAAWMYVTSSGLFPIRRTLLAKHTLHALGTPLFQKQNSKIPSSPESTTSEWRSSPLPRIRID